MIFKLSAFINQTAFEGRNCLLLRYHDNRPIFSGHVENIPYCMRDRLVVDFKIPATGSLVFKLTEFRKP